MRGATRRWIFQTLALLGLTAGIGFLAYGPADLRADEPATAASTPAAAVEGWLNAVKSGDAEAVANGLTPASRAAFEEVGGAALLDSMTVYTWRVEHLNQWAQNPVARVGWKVRFLQDEFVAAYIAARSATPAAQAEGAESPEVDPALAEEADQLAAFLESYLQRPTIRLGLRPADGDGAGFRIALPDDLLAGPASATTDGPTETASPTRELAARFLNALQAGDTDAMVAMMPVSRRVAAARELPAVGAALTIESFDLVTVATGRTSARAIYSWTATFDGDLLTQGLLDAQEGVEDGTPEELAALREALEANEEAFAEAIERPLHSMLLTRTSESDPWMVDQWLAETPVAANAVAGADSPEACMTIAMEAFRLHHREAIREIFPPTAGAAQMEQNLLPLFGALLVDRPAEARMLTGDEVAGMNPRARIFELRWAVSFDVDTYVDLVFGAVTPDLRRQGLEGEALQQQLDAIEGQVRAQGNQIRDLHLLSYGCRATVQQIGNSWFITGLQPNPVLLNDDYIAQSE